MKFKLSKKGYDIGDVDAYITNRERLDKDSIHDKLLRIEELKAQLARSETELSDYKRKSESISLALIDAIDKAKDMEMSAKLRYTLELERLKLFRAKWHSVAKKAIMVVTSTDKLAEIDNRLRVIEVELAAMAQTSLGLATTAFPQINPTEESYIAESKRLIDRIKADQKDKARDISSTNSKINIKESKAIEVDASATDILSTEDETLSRQHNLRDNGVSLNLDDINMEHDLMSLLNGL